MEVIIKRSKKKEKKFDAIIDGKKTISFGSAGMSDMTQHKDPERKQIYIYILTVIRKTKTGMMQKRPAFMPSTSCGINQHCNRQSLISTRNFQS